MVSVSPNQNSPGISSEATPGEAGEYDVAVIGGGASRVLEARL
jgi:hypothetical protein